MPNEPQSSTAAQRLGKRELGRHAFETRMPARISLLITPESAVNKLRNVIPVLAALLAADPDVETAHLCRSHVTQIYKVKGEGDHFCGYRNIQMLLSGGGDHTQPSIPELQAAIEHAWDQGFNAHGRAQTGGVIGTRKHIGTSEAEALLQSRGIPCRGHVFSGKTSSTQLLDFAEQYFSSSSADGPSVRRTARHPLFLQRPQHSMTIIGVERLRSGKRRLLVFDPGYDPPSAVQRYLEETKGKGTEQGRKLPSYVALRRYRRNEWYLRWYAGFEVLERLDGTVAQ